MRWTVLAYTVLDRFKVYTSRPDLFLNSKNVDVETTFPFYALGTGRFDLDSSGWFNHYRLTAVMDAWESTLLSQFNSIVGIGRSIRKNEIVLYVSSDADILHLPKEIEGIPTRIENTGIFFATSATSMLFLHSP